MNQHTSMHFHACPRQRISTFLLIVSTFFCILAGSIIASPIAQAQGVPGGNISSPVVSAVDIAEPAVVRIITKVAARLTVTFTTGNRVTFPQDGTSYPLEISGSGSFITAHGDIVTADHVVHPPRADMTDYLYQTAAPDIANYLNTTYGMNPPYDENQAYYALTTGTFRSDSQFDAPSSQAYLSTAYTGPQDVKTIKSVSKNYVAPIDNIEDASSFEKEDLAIIHIGMNDTPSIPLGDSTAVSQQDELTIVGFPGNADITERDDPTQLFTSSVNKVLVSAIKQDDNGVNLIQVSGNVEHGDSGGPALDSHGNLVGVVSFQKDSNNGETNSTSFLHVSENIKQMVASLKLNTTPGKLQQAWLQGFRDYAATSPGHWHKAAADFTKLASDYPDFKALKTFSDYAQTQAKHEALPQSTTNSGSPFIYLLISLGGIVLLLIVGIAIFSQLKRRSPYAPALNNFQANTTVAKSNIPNASAYSNLSLPASPSQAAAPLTPWEQQIADSSTWKPATTPTFKEQPYVNPVAWNTPPALPHTPNYVGGGTTGEIKRENVYNNKRSAPLANELPAAWASEDAIIVDPLPLSSSQADSKSEEITNKRKAIQREQDRRQPVPSENTGPQFDWPLPTTWQQIQTPPQEARKEPTQNPPQEGSGSTATFDFNKGRQP